MRKERNKVTDPVRLRSHKVSLEVIFISGQFCKRVILEDYESKTR